MAICLPVDPASLLPLPPTHCCRNETAENQTIVRGNSLTCFDCQHYEAQSETPIDTADITETIYKDGHIDEGKEIGRAHV